MLLVVATTGHVSVTHVTLQLAWCTVEQTRPTSVPDVMPLCMLPTGWPRAMIVFGCARHVSVPQLPSCARQTLHPYAHHVMLKSTLPIHLHVATSVSRFFQFQDAYMAPWSMIKAV